MNERPTRRSSRVPSGRLERLARFGLLTGELVATSLAGGARRLVGAAPSTDPLQVILSADNARRIARRLASMRGAAMKLGQILSLEGPDILPPEFAEALAVLRAGADTMPPAQVRRVLGREYGKGWEERFAHFDFEPIAAASIGQVHAARAADGREIALKVQYPGVARSISSDVDNVATVLRLARLLPVKIDVSGIVAEAKRQLHQEVDYLREAESQCRYRELVADEPRLVVPVVHRDLTTRRILAMDRARGLPIEDLAGAAAPQARRDAAGELLQRLAFRELFEFRFVQTDPNFANYLLEDGSDRIVLLDFGSAREYPPEMVGRYRHLCRAVLSGDREGVRRAAVEIGYLAPDERADRVPGVVDLILLVCEPLRHVGRYDFGRSQLAARARDAGVDLVFRRGFVHAPPPETIFLHRKLVGTFLLCARIGACVDAHALVRPLVS